jgi:putative ABC transport system substrate-binding protein
MKKTALSSILVVVVLLAAVTAEAQQSTKIPRIGYLSGGFASSGAPRIDGFRQGLGELGYVEGKNIVIESRHAEGKPDRIPALAAELVRLKVEVIVTGGGGGATRAAKEATKTIPIVRQGMSTLSDRGPCQPCAAWRQRHWIVILLKNPLLVFVIFN